MERGHPTRGRLGYRTLLNLGFLAFVLVVLVTGAFSIYGLRSLNQATDEMGANMARIERSLKDINERHEPLIRGLEEMRREILQAQLNLYKAIAGYTPTIRDVWPHVEALHGRVADFMAGPSVGSAVLEGLSAIDGRIQEYRTVLRKLDNLRTLNQPEIEELGAQALAIGSRISDMCRSIQEAAQREVEVAARRSMADALASIQVAERFRERAHRIGTINMGAVVLGVACSLLIAFFVKGVITSSIEKLHEGARLIGQGNLDHRLSVETEDELGKLADEFNQMAARLKEAYSGLEQKVDERTRALSQSLERVRALSEVIQAVGSSLDLETVLATIVSRANQLSGTDSGAVFEFDEPTGEFRLRATENLPEELVEVLRATPLRRGEGTVGRLADTREPVQTPDIAAEGAYQSPVRDVLLQSGYHALLAVPLRREEEVIGGLVVNRRTPGEFSTEVIDILTTFANQSAVAIQNARLFQEIEEKSRQLEVASQHKSLFLANMSHELRTPLNAIIGYSEMLQEEALDLGQERFVADLQKINAAGKHLLELINAVLDLSKIEAGKMELYLESFSVAVLVNDIAAVIRPLAEKNGNRLEMRCDDDVGVMRADLTKVRQTLFNLLSNACKFTEHGTVSLTIAREPGPAGDWITFSVGDTGIGMTPEQMARLFQEFSTDAPTMQKYGGTGLGLALSRRLCRMMGGDITAVNEAGAGSTFTVRLPAAVVDTRGEPLTAATPGSTGAATGAGTVLVVDDEPAVRELMQRFLAREGFRVVTAAGGEEGLRLAKAIRPDAITLDVLMPHVDGWAVLAALKTDPETAEIPVIMLTIVDDRNRGYALGAADYLTKPVDRDRLLGVLRRHRRGNVPILVVDDDPAFRELMRRMLEKEGYAVIEAENGRVALDRVRQAPPALILLDLIMPEMDGFEFMAEFREHEEWRAIPVVIVTVRHLSVEERLQLGGYVEKIVEKGAHTLDSLLREVRELILACIRRRAV
jgi:hypothetical protein